MSILSKVKALIILGLLSAGCVPAAIDPIRKLPAAEPEVLPERLTLPGYTSTLTPSATSTPGPDPTKILPSPGVTAQPEQEVEICSPLGENELHALAEIVSSPYSAPPVGREERHHGVDFSYYQNGQRESIAGEIVMSVTRGRVALVLQESFPYGNAVVVETRLSDLPVSWQEALEVARRDYSSGFQNGRPESIYFLYAHLQNAPMVELEQSVEACTQLGVVGKSGNAGVAHLHLEMRLGPSGARLDDMGYYLYEITPQQREAYLRWRISGEFQHVDPLVFLSLK